MTFKCYGQIIFECGSMAAPMPDDFERWPSMAAARRDLKRYWHNPVINDGLGVTLLLWLGEPDPDDPFPCDTSHNYPDRIYELGPLGGARRLE